MADNKKPRGINLDFQALASEFWDKGYLYIEDFFDNELMDRYQGLALSHFSENPRLCS